MKKLATIIALSALLAGCTLTGARSGNVERDNQPDTVDTTEDHLGDPTFTEEVTKPEQVQTPEPADSPAETDNAVVDTGDTAPRTIEPAVDADFEKGMELFAEGKLRDARMSLTASLNNNLDEDTEAEALKTLRDINARIFMSTGPAGDLTVYTVKSGDTLGKIAKARGTTWEMIVRVNEMDSTRINVGDELKILGGTFELVVRKSKFVMDLMLDGAFIQRYEVGLGKDGCTPLGEFVVKNRIPKPADGSYPYGHEKHRLGSRWLGLKNDAGYKGYGIHGCRPEQYDEIGTECSEGCVRMTNEDVEEIYDIVPAGTRVVIQTK